MELREVLEMVFEMDLKNLSKTRLEISFSAKKVVDPSPGTAGHVLHQIVNNP